MKRLERIAAITLALAALGITGTSAKADTKLDPAYRRAVPREFHRDRPQETVPLPRALQADAITETPEAAPVETRSGVALRTRPPSGKPGSHPVETPHIRDSAVRAARWTANELVERFGRREYFRVGFHTGLGQALADPRLGRVDRLQGRRDGNRDSQAREIGFDLGLSAAQTLARDAAAIQVTDQFHDLSRDPVYGPLAGTPSFTPPPVQVDEPSLREVLEAYPFGQFTPLGPRGSFLAGWKMNPWQLYRSSAYTDFFDGAWLKPEFALAVWLREGPRRAVFHELRTPADRELFKRLFHAQFSREMGRLFATRLQRSYDLGLDDGWAYGAFAREELEYRQAYAEAFRQLVDISAQTAFLREYPLSYEEAYARSFTDWSDNPKPEIGQVVLRDGNDDGVFQPGEPLLADIEVTNFGGSGGTLTARLEGAVLSVAGRAEVLLPARRRVGLARPLQAVIDPLAPSRTRTSLRLSVLDASRELPLLVAHPLEFRSQPARIERDDLSGRVSVAVEVVNRSRRGLGGSVSVASLSGGRQERQVEAIEPHGSSIVEFTVTGLSPLGLIGGAVSLDIEVRNGTTLQDRLELNLPGTASNLRNRDLLQLMIAMARAGSFSGPEIDRVRQLLLARLRADWRASIEARGNPYKADFRHGSRRTALGDLAQTYLAEKAGFTRPEVFDGLGTDVALLARELPGAHPFLRKYVRKLARELP